MGDYGGIGDGIVFTFKVLFAIAVISLPLALWKLWEIGIWFFSHIQFNF